MYLIWLKLIALMMVISIIAIHQRHQQDKHWHWHRVVTLYLGNNDVVIIWNLSYNNLRSFLWRLKISSIATQILDNLINCGQKSWMTLQITQKLNNLMV